VVGRWVLSSRVSDGSSQWRLRPADIVTLRLLPGSTDLLSSGSRVLLDESTI